VLSRPLVSHGVVSDRRIDTLFVAGRIASHNVGCVLLLCFQITSRAEAFGQLSK
jgi:hypothetical protein